MMFREVRQTPASSSASSSSRNPKTKPQSGTVQRLTLTLSPRQAQIIGCRCTLGLSFKEISDKLGISIHTVKHHTTEAFARLGVNNSLAAACLLASRK